MTLAIRFKVKVSDLVTHIEREYGGLEALAQYITRHPDDSMRVLIYEAAMRNQHTPRKVLSFGRLYVGDSTDILGAARLQLLELIMRNPGISLREAARELHRTPSTIHELVDAFQGLGLVTKESAGPGRSVALRAVPHEIRITLTRGGEPAR